MHSLIRRSAIAGDYLLRPVRRCLLCDEPIRKGEEERRVTKGGTVVYVHRPCLERVERRSGRPWDQDEAE